MQPRIDILHVMATQRPADTPMRIGDVADVLGLNPKTIRYYEEIGVLPRADRTDAGHRVYGDEDIERLGFIRAAQRLGFSLDEIREILAFRDRADRPCAYVIDVLDRRVDELADRIAEMQDLKRTLVHLRRSAQDLPDGDSWCCQVIEHQPG